MREIKFKGKRIDNDEIIFGCLVSNMWTYSELSQFEKGTKVCEIFTGEFGSDNWIDAIEEDNFIFSVYPNSVGQYIGLSDELGKEIYEGDILISPLGEIFKVKFRNAMFVLENKNGVTRSINYNLNMWKIIGNIHEHPELLK